MNDMSGWEVYDQIKDNPAWDDIPIVFLTARTDRIAENAGDFLGDNFLEKPAVIENIIDSMNKVLKKK